MEVSLDKSFESGENILNKDINDFELSIRACQSLRNAGINNFSEIISKSEDFFSATNRFDLRSREEIINLVKNNGFDFKLEK